MKERGKLSRGIDASIIALVLKKVGEIGVKEQVRIYLIKVGTLNIK